MTSTPFGESLTGGERQQFYGFTVNRESALDVFSKRRIIAVTDLKIVEWHSYKHLDSITGLPNPIDPLLLCRLLQNDTRAQSGLYTTHSSIQR
nr:hypothetical protein [Tanacetum cinerariifolium]